MEECERALDHAKERRQQRSAAALELKTQLRDLLEDFAQTREEISLKFLQLERGTFAKCDHEAIPQHLQITAHELHERKQWMGMFTKGNVNIEPLTASLPKLDAHSHNSVTGPQRLVNTEHMGEMLVSQARAEGCESTYKAGTGESMLLADTCSQGAAEFVCPIVKQAAEGSRHLPKGSSGTSMMTEQTQTLLDEVLARSRAVRSASKVQSDALATSTKVLGLGGGMHDQQDTMQLGEVTKQLPEVIENPRRSWRTHGKSALSASPPDSTGSGSTGTRMSPSSSTTSSSSMQPSVLSATWSDSSPSLQVQKQESPLAFSAALVRSNVPMAPQAPQSPPVPTVPSSSSTSPQTPSKSAVCGTARTALTWHSRYLPVGCATSPVSSSAQSGPQAVMRATSPSAAAVRASSPPAAAAMATAGDATPSRVRSPRSKSRSQANGPAVCLPLAAFASSGSDLQRMSPGRVQGSGSPAHPTSAKSPCQSPSSVPSMLRPRSETSLSRSAMQRAPPRVVQDQHQAQRLFVFPRSSMGGVTPTRLRSETPPVFESQKTLPRAISPQRTTSSVLQPSRLVRSEMSTGTPKSAREEKQELATVMSVLKELRELQQHAEREVEKEAQPSSVAYSSIESSSLQSMKKLGPTEVPGFGLVEGATSIARLLLQRLPSSAVWKAEQSRRLG